MYCLHKLQAGSQVHHWGQNSAMFMMAWEALREGRNLADVCWDATEEARCSAASETWKAQGRRKSNQNLGLHSRPNGLCAIDSMIFLFPLLEKFNVSFGTSVAHYIHATTDLCARLSLSIRDVVRR
eukprot:s2202_g11.t1